MTPELQKRFYDLDQLLTHYHNVNLHQDLLGEIPLKVYPDDKRLNNLVKNNNRGNIYSYGIEQSNNLRSECHDLMLLIYRYNFCDLENNPTLEIIEKAKELRLQMIYYVDNFIAAWVDLYDKFITTFNEEI